jgi:hypothetical protein
MQVDNSLERLFVTMTPVPIEQLPVALGRECPVATQPVDLLEE